MKIEFYRAEHLAALKKKEKLWRAAFVLVCTASALAVAFCALSRTTLNAARMELYATGALTVGGWIAITIREAALRYLRALRGHEERILSSEAEERRLRGLVTLEKKRVHVSGSIDVRGVRVQTPGGAVRLLVNDAYAGALKKAAAQGELSLTAVEGYITEAER